MNLSDLATVDFETEKVESRPRYPPRPVGVAIRQPDGRKKYWAWGHKSGNNCTKSEAAAELARIYSLYRILFYNGQFDLDVGTTHLGLPVPRRFEDALFVAFLRNPHERSLELKVLAPRDLGMPANERDDLREWIIENIKGAARGVTTWKEYIADAPGKLVGRYACGDVEMTFRFFRKFYPEILLRGMGEAYEREIACVPITLEMERGGIRADSSGLEECGGIFGSAKQELFKIIRKKLKVGKDFNLNSGEQLGEALVRGKFLNHISRTPGGKIATGADVLEKNCNDKELLRYLQMHSVVSKAMNTFIYPWLEQATISGGRILPHYNQTRGSEEGGTRSGRYSSSNPNLQQVMADVKESKNKVLLELLQLFLYEKFGYRFTGLRAFLLPDEDSILISVDYGQQELRLLAHFERGELMQHYIRDPNFDLHDYIRRFIFKQTGIDYPRKFIKVTVFSIIYGAGKKKIQMQLDVDWKTAETVYDGVFAAVPGLRRLIDDLKDLAADDLPLTTWGGREYFCEEDQFNPKNGEYFSLEYKMLNYQIQPSAADMTKQGMIQVRQRVPEARLAVQVHDELLCMAPRWSCGPRISAAMCDIKLNVPVLADPKYSLISWGSAKSDKQIWLPNERRKAA